MSASPPSPIRVLVVDDSPFMQRRLTDILHATPDLRVAGCAANGAEAITLAQRLRPDVITMDINMPKMDGLQAIDVIMRTDPRPIVVISSYTRKLGHAALDTLEMGVIDIIEKPSDTGIALDLDRHADEITRKLRQAARIRVIRTGGGHPAARPAAPEQPAPARQKTPVAPPSVIADPSLPQVVAIGSSTGGPSALRRLFRAIPDAHFPPLLVVQHLPARFTRDLAEQLNAVSTLEVVEAQTGMTLRYGHAFVAPGGQHMEIDAGHRIVLTCGPPVKYCRPAVDVLFESLARHASGHTLAFILTGMGDDGTDGARALKTAGAQVIAQDEDSSLVFGMPRAAIEAGVTDHILSLDQIEAHLIQLGRRTAAHLSRNRPGATNPSAPFAA